MASSLSSSSSSFIIDDTNANTTMTTGLSTTTQLELVNLGKEIGRREDLKTAQKKEFLKLKQKLDKVINFNIYDYITNNISKEDKADYVSKIICLLQMIQTLQETYWYQKDTILQIRRDKALLKSDFEEANEQIDRYICEIEELEKDQRLHSNEEFKLRRSISGLKKDVQMWKHRTCSTTVGLFTVVVILVFFVPL